MNRLARAAAGVILIAPLLTLTGCLEDPCPNLPAPTRDELALADDGVEIEREIDGTDCELVDGDWTQESE